MREKTWRFVNPKMPSEVITVHDEASAQTLRAILLSDGLQKWQVEEISAETSEPPSPAQARNQGPQDTSERRTEKRYPANFRIILVSGSNSFRTTSIDVSNGGMLLSQKVPASFAGKKCFAYITAKDTHESIELICELVGDQKDLQRVSFSESDTTSITRLEEWIKIHQNSQG